jgi:preprotein translocase subunit SecE
MTNEVQTKASLVDRVRGYLRDTRIELRKVVWPTREETINLSTVVLLVTLVMTLILGALDSVFSTLVAAILNIATGG